MREFPLGRRIEHDVRSRQFAFKAPVYAVPRTVLWTHSAPVLDQGTLGSCTGNALAQFLNTDAILSKRGGRVLNQADAVSLYTLATRLDQFPGEYPPVDTGSSALGVCKAGIQQGYLTKYEWAFGLQAVLAALQNGPVITGTSWMTGMFTPTSSGVIRATGSEAGGHEYLILGCDVEQEHLIILNSWGPGWGENGRAKIPFSDYTMLLQQFGDATVPIPVVSSTPIPPPTPRRPKYGDRVRVLWGKQVLIMKWTRRGETLEKLKVITVLEVL